MKKITILWTIILLIIVTGLTIIGFYMKNKNVDNVYEKALVEQTEKYLGMYPGLYPKFQETLKLTNEELVENGYDTNIPDTCSGYIIVTNNNQGFDYKPFVKCPEYVTEGYEE